MGGASLGPRARRLAAGLLAGCLLLFTVPARLPPPPEDTAPALPAAGPAALPASPPPETAVLLSPDRPEEAGGNGSVLLPMKGADGSLAFVSSLPLAAACGASLDRPARNEALRALARRAGLHTVALVSCFRDDALGSARPALVLRGAPPEDGQGRLWLDPAAPAVQAYLTGLCRELAGLGFDEILLTDCRYPPGGASAGPRSAWDRAAVLEGFCRRLRTALAKDGVLLSVRAEGGGSGGQSPALLALFSRVWRQPEEADAVPAGLPCALLPADVR